MSVAEGTGLKESLGKLPPPPSDLMSSSLAKMMMPRALGVSMSLLITLLNSPGFGSLGILMDWAIQTPPGHWEYQSQCSCHQPAQPPRLVTVFLGMRHLCWGEGVWLRGSQGDIWPLGHQTRAGPAQGRGFCLPMVPSPHG